MLDKNYIKPIPKKILARIQAFDRKRYKTPNGNTRFYSYLATWKKELVNVTVAVRHYKEQWFCKQVAVHGLNSPNTLVKDVEYIMIAGYVVGWYDIKACARKKHWEDGLWYSYSDRKYFNMYAPTVNLNYLKRFPEYQYSEYANASYNDILSFLRIYKEFPEAEYLIKSGLKHYAMNKMILRQVRKDKSFHKWLIAHKDSAMENGRYYCEALLQAYRKHIPISQVQKFEERKRHLIHDYHGKMIVKLVINKGVVGEYERFFKYLDKQGISDYLYLEYIRACDNLNLDCKNDQIRYPNNFHRWHDLRIAQLHKNQRKESRHEKEMLARNFLIAAEKYLPLAGFTNDEDYAIFLAKSPAELVKEGRALSHCVGYNGYDKKMANEETIIFFVRKINELDKPFVTLEYSIKQKKILQCYAYGNQKPEDKVLEFVNNKWLPYANQQLEKIAA